MITDTKEINKLEKEHKDLHTKMERLAAFITSDVYSVLTWKEKFYLHLQKCIMKMYCKVLVKRIELNKKLIELYAEDKKD